MRTRFLIVGLTGPIGSGCSTVADFLSRGLSNYAMETQEKLPHIKALIGDYYRYLRGMQNSVEKSKTDYLESISDALLKPDELLKTITTYETSNKELSENHRKILNRRLRGLIIKRDIFNVFKKTKWPNFTVVSMSDLIIFHVIKNSINSDSKQTSEFIDYDKNKLPQSIKEKIFKLAEYHIETISNYKLIMENKNYDKLDYETCKKIDQMFSDIHELKIYINQFERIDEEWLQDLGDNFRATGNPFITYRGNAFNNLEDLAAEANLYIKYMRRRKDGNNQNYFVIDSFRNPEEVNFFRKRYGTFFLCSVYANKKIRKIRLDKKSFFSEKRELRDQGKGNSARDLHKQNVPGCVLISDYAINNEGEKEDLKFKIARLLVLIDRPGWITPTAEESFMNMAYSLSLRSRCLSRQVGAVITNSDGFIIGAGWNDVGSGQLGCSTRCLDDYYKYTSADSLLSVWDKQIEKFKEEKLLEKFNDDDYFCFKDVQSDYHVSKKLDDIFNSYFKEEKESYKELINTIKENIGIKRLEYARALHAEENAILQVATYGGMGISGGTIYTTTFPCELCAKKIYQSGIKRIVYTEPYPESISESIFLKDGVRDINLEQFEGVKSNSFYKLFKSPLDRKDMQKINDIYYKDS